MVFKDIYAYVGILCFKETEKSTYTINQSYREAERAQNTILGGLDVSLTIYI